MKLERIFFLVFSFLFCLNIKSSEADRIKTIDERLTALEVKVFGQNKMKKFSEQRKKEDEQFEKRFTQFTIGSILTTLVLVGITIKYGKHCENKENNETFQKLVGITGTTGLISSALLFVKIISYFSPHTTF